MPLSTYAELQTSILSWLARPGDPLVSPAVPDMIQLFEREATRRLKVGGAEKRASLTALSAAVALPADFGELRLATSGGVILTYVTPMQLPGGGGSPAHYTIVGNEMRLGPSPSGGCTIEIVYQSGVPPLSDANVSNWLLAQHPDCYLFGSLVEAESFIGSDDRIPLWAQRREAAFSSIESADRKARWGGAPLSIRAEGVSGGNGMAAGDWTSAPPVPIPITGIVAGDGLSGGGTEGLVTVALDTPVTIGRGGTGATTAADALVNLGAAPLNSPALIGNPTAPTPSPGDADTSVATTAFVQAALTSGGGMSQLTGDVTAGPGSGSQASTIAANAVTTAKIANAAVTYGKVQNILAARLLGNPTGSAAPPSEITLGTNLSFAGSVLSATGGASITIGDTAPASPSVGNGWWDSVGGQLYLWYNDGTSSQWVPASNLVGGAGDVVGPGAAVGGNVASFSGITGKLIADSGVSVSEIKREVFAVAVSDEVTALTTGVAKLAFRMPWAMTLSSVRSSLTAASSSGLVTVDIKESGTTILSTALSIDVSEKTSTTAATPAVISDTTLADDAEITIDITAAGTGAKGLKVTLIGMRS